MATVFDYLNSINNKTSVEFEPSEYNHYIVMKGLSYFPDTVLIANELNMYDKITPEQSYIFYFNLIPKKKRFSKWYKPTSLDNVEFVMEYYQVNRELAEEYLTLLTEEDLKVIEAATQKGGVEKVSKK